MARHTLSKLALLDYALEGAVTRRGVTSGHLDDDEMELLNKDIAEIERRIKLVEIAEARKKKP